MTAPTAPAMESLQLARVLNAVIAVASDSELTSALEEVVQAAATLVGARYGALGVIDRDGGRLERFVHTGLAARQAAAIGAPPRGHGVLGALLDENGSLRLDDVSDHPESTGFPPGHPAMRSFLGVPVRSHGAVFGNFYLAEKAGGEPFTEDDQAIVEALAAAAGSAVAISRLLRETDRRAQAERASRHIMTAVLSGSPVEDVLQEVAEHARRLSNAETALVLLPQRGGGLTVEMADGERAEQTLGAVALPGDPLAGMLANHQPLSLSGRPADRVLDLDGPAVAVPLLTGESALGALVVVRAPGARPFSTMTPSLLEVFAQQAALSLMLGQAADDRHALAVHQDRERIGRDLHDLVIQRIYAAGMSLSAVSEQAPPDVQERIEETVAVLDETIREIRSTIFQLQPPVEQAMPSLRSRVLAEAEDATQALGFAPTVSFRGALDSLVPDDVADDVVAALRELLSNVARHANAQHAHVTVAVGHGPTPGVDLVVEDDGRGMTNRATGGRGLANLDARARALGGTFTTASNPDGGSHVAWSVPLAG